MKTTLGFFSIFSLVLAMPLASHAATTIAVTQANPQGWSTADTRPGGAVNFLSDPSSPAPLGALQLTTTSATTAKAQFLHAADTLLANTTGLGYYTKQNSASFNEGAASYQLVTFLNGGTSGFSTLVFEPYQNPTQGTVTAGVWQHWDVSSGLFWSTRTVACANGTVAGAPGGPASYTLSQITSLCPNAHIVGFGVNVGSNNPSYDVETDLVAFNGTVYDFQVVNAPVKEKQCKDGGFASLTDANGNVFVSEKSCKKFVEGLHEQEDHGEDMNDK